MSTTAGPHDEQHGNQETEMDQHTIEHLESSLRQVRTDDVGGPALAEIHRLGERRRRGRTAGAALGGVAAVSALVATLSVTGAIGATTARDVAPASAPEPSPSASLRPLAARALAEIPGAVQVSSSQVVLPGEARLADGMDEPVPDSAIEVGPIDVGAHSYDGVTGLQRSAFPSWLYDGVEKIERGELADDDGSYPVGSTQMGILVDSGELRLACMHSLPQWGGDPDGPCFPAMLSGSINDGWQYAWGMGTDDFLRGGKPLELFSTSDYSTGAHREIWVGGTDGTDVATVELVGVDGQHVDADVASGTLVDGETMFWGALTEDLAVAITRDADGQVLERHEVKPCSGGVDCEVR